MSKLNKEAVDEITKLLAEVQGVVRLLKEFGILVSSDCWSATSFSDEENILTWGKENFEEYDILGSGDKFYIGGNVVTGSQHKYKGKWIIAPKELAEIEGKIFEKYLVSAMQSVPLKHFEVELKDEYGLINNCGWEHWLVIEATVKKDALEEKDIKTKKLIKEFRDKYECYTYTAFNDDFDNIQTLDNINGYNDEYACCIEVFSELVEPIEADFGVTDEYIDRVAEIRDNMRQLKMEIEHYYKEQDVKATLSKWNQGCENGMAMYIWIPFQ